MCVVQSDVWLVNLDISIYKFYQIGLWMDASVCVCVILCLLCVCQ